MTFEKVNNMIDDISWSYGGKSITKQDIVECREKCHEALEKQIPKKPIGDLHSCPHYRCPSCHRSVVLYEDDPKYPCCQWCGQKLNWNK